MSDLTTSTRPVPDGMVIELAGELDFVTAARFRETLQQLTLRPGQRLILDLGGLAFCDSSGITAFLAARNLALAVQADIALAAVPPHTARILGMVGLDQVFPIHPDTATASSATG
ncbi:STAS domain-containing protein [Streptomyces sp. NPDC058391]|uniref:STAS domain-containing protein n=1 Tax=Streptomyces sp. NPDC058391 TaxID=3346476 RepID=UPI003649E549